MMSISFRCHLFFGLRVPVHLVVMEIYATAMAESMKRQISLPRMRLSSLRKSNSIDSNEQPLLPVRYVAVDVKRTTRRYRRCIAFLGEIVPFLPSTRAMTESGQELAIAAGSFVGELANFWKTGAVRFSLGGGCQVHLG